MPRIVAKFATPAGDRYLVWSTIVEAPITFGMELDDLVDWISEQMGKDYAEQFVETRIPRIERTGTSTGEAVTELIRLNRAGLGETRLTLEQIIDFFCVRCGQGDEPTGTPPDDDPPTGAR